MSQETLIVAVAQTSSEPGDVAANARAAVDSIRAAAESGAKLLMFPELSSSAMTLTSSTIRRRG
ncbi:nitrilase-related carbon-nitrogen hydrolase [Streptosporangium lutulentum]